MAITVEARNDLISIVVGMFNAAPGVSVLSDLTVAREAGQTRLQIATNLAKSAEYLSIYPELMTNAEFATALVNNMVGNLVSATAKSDAVAMLTGILNSKNTSTPASKALARAEVTLTALDALKAVPATDATFGAASAALTNKVEVASHYSVVAKLNPTSVSNAQSILQNVDSSAASVTSAKATIDGSVNAGQTFSLTASLDTINGGAGNDTINALATTLTIGDNINGGAGDDTIALTSVLTAAASASGFTVSNVENLSVNVIDGDANTGHTLALNLINTAVGAVTITGSSATTAADTVSLTNVALGTDISLNSVADMAVTAAYAGATGASDAMDLHLAGVTSTDAGDTVITAANIETVNINVASTSVVGTLTTAAATTYNVTGAGNLTVKAALGTSVKTISAASATGKLVLTTGNTADAGGAVDGVDLTVNTGSGNDTVNVSASDDTDELAVDLGAGDDTLTIGDSFNNASATTKGDVFAGGVGTDTLVVDADIVDTTAADSADTNDAAWTGAAAATTFSGMSGFEILALDDLDNSTAADTVTVAAISADITTVHVLDATAESLTVNFAAGTYTVGLKGAISAGDTLTVTAAGTGTTDSLTIANALTAGNIGTATSVIATTGFEAVTLNTGSYATAAAQDVNTINIGATGALTITGSNGLTTAGAITAKSIDAASAGAIVLGAATTATSITTGSKADTILTGNTATTVNAGDGNDSVTGGTGADTLNGGAGNDAIVGGGGNDTLNGGDGNDTITGNTGNDTITGGAGNDSITTNSGNDNVDAGAGDDTITVAGNLAFEDTIAGGDGTDTLSISATVSSIAQTANVSGIEIINTSASQDLSLFAGTGYTTVQLGAVTAAITKAAAGTGLLVTGVLSGASSFALATATGTSDSLTITSKSSGGLTQAAALTLAGFETINLVGDDTDATANGDVNTYYFSAADATTIIVSGDQGYADDASAAAAKVTTFDASGVTVGAVTYTTLNTTIGESITIKGGAGGDTLAGHSNTNDTIHGGAGNDTITAGDGTNVLHGDAGDDSLTGGTGADTMDGGAGADTLVYSGGADLATGGAGVDTFDVNSDGTAAAHLNILDLSDADKIDLAGVDDGTAGIADGAIGAKITLGAAATLTQYLNEAAKDTTDANTDGTLDVSLAKWFQYDGNTYIVVDNGTSATFGAGDSVVKITGLVDLSASVFASSVLTIDL